MSTNSSIAAHPSIPADRDILVCIFQRGAADGLNALVPYTDPDYILHRPTIAVPNPGQPNGGIALPFPHDDYALHPALAPLEQIFLDGNLALVHATGVPHGSRSHFSAQGLIERGVTDKAGPNTGWLGRHLALTPPASGSAFRIVSISGNVPVALTGASEPLAISNLAEFGFDQGIVDSGYPEVLASLFQSPVPFFAPAGAALAAIEELQAADLAAYAPLPGVYPDTPLGNKLAQAGQLIKSPLPVEVLCMDSDGWDHHESLPTYIDLSLTELADALRVFYDDLGTTAMQRITVLVYTEFGRRVGENGSVGVDHGTGSLAYLIGGGVNGGQVISTWPGLNEANGDLEMGEDLKITTDLRSVITEMLDKRLGGTTVGTVFPGFAGVTDVNAFLS